MEGKEGTADHELIVSGGKYSIRNLPEGLPGGAMVKNPPASEGDMGSILGPGRSHMPWSN